MVPRCEHCHLTVMACPDPRWAQFYGVYPLWLPKSIVDRMQDEGRVIVEPYAMAWAEHLRSLGLI